MKRFLAGTALLALVALAFTACGGGNSSSSSSSKNGGATQAHVFVTGEDAPVSSVVAFNITINQITLNNSSTSVVAMNTPTAVDFGRLVGLRSLLGFNAIAPGTYTTATITFATTPAPVIDYINLTTTTPSLGTATAVLSNAKVTVAFPSNQPLVVDNNGLAGLHLDFNLRESLALNNGNLVINNSQIAVNPMLAVTAVSASSDLGQITDFTGNVVSVGANSFAMQGPYGFEETIDVDPNTHYNNSETTLASLVVNGIVSVEGTVQADGTILANSVELITTDQAFLGGRILAVSPGPVVTMFVGEELGTSATIPVDSIQTVDLSQVPTWDICFIDNWFTNELFGPTYLVVGQRIFVGGTYQSKIFTPSMVSLRRQGIVGSLVEGTVNIVSQNLGGFEMQNDALLSYAAGGPFPVATDNQTVFVNIAGLMGLQSAGAANLVVTGLVFDNPQALGTPVAWVHRVRVLP